MDDDWRLRVDLHEEGLAHQLTERLEAFDLAHDLKITFGDRVIVSRDGPEVFCYTSTRDQAEAAGSAIRSVAGEHGWALDLRLERWHPTAGEWEEPPLVGAEDAAQAEHAALLEREGEEAAHHGYPEYEVRVRCPFQAEARQLAERLQSEGFQVVQRGEFLLLGAADEDSANALAERIRDEAPAGSGVSAEGSVPEVVSGTPFGTPFSPFAVFGGLGG
jgi:hypothetical protein